jgi:hypothetical protein
MINNSLFEMHRTNYYVIPWRRALIGRTMVPQSVKKFPEFDEARLFITVVTKAWFWSISKSHTFSAPPPSTKLHGPFHFVHLQLINSVTSDEKYQSRRFSLSNILQLINLLLSSEYFPQHPVLGHLSQCSFDVISEQREWNLIRYSCKSACITPPL